MFLFNETFHQKIGTKALKWMNSFKWPSEYEFHTGQGSDPHQLQECLESVGAGCSDIICSLVVGYLNQGQILRGVCDVA